MRIVPKEIIVLPLLFCLSVAASQDSWATLGGTRDTVQADEVQMRATRRIASHTGYEVHALTLDSGTVVKEFVAPSGTVFAVAWQGPFKPDLNKLLGEHFSRLVAAGRQPHGDHRMLSVHAADLVIESGGRMRGFAGRAYLPALMPATASVEDIR